MILSHKCIVTIVKKGWARKIVKASKEAGAEGGTVMLARGTGIHETKTFLGIHVEPEKEVILTLAPSERLPAILTAMQKAGKLNKPGYGVGFVVDTKKLSGIVHLQGDRVLDCEGGKGMASSPAYNLIVSIVNKGYSEKVVEASKKAGAEGGTIIFGRGTGIHEQAKLFSITIEPEKEIVLTLIERSKTEEVMETITKDVQLNKPGKGISFVLEVEQTVGINHVLNRMVSEAMDQMEENDT